MPLALDIENVKKLRPSLVIGEHAELPQPMLYGHCFAADRTEDLEIEGRFHSNLLIKEGQRHGAGTAQDSIKPIGERGRDRNKEGPKRLRRKNEALDEVKVPGWRCRRRAIVEVKRRRIRRNAAQDAMEDTLGR
jgi:hypothetical protein